MANELITPYATAMPYVSSKPSWLNDYDAQRLASYDLYEDLYRNNPDSVSALIRGSDGKPILVPTAKRFINTIGRYVLRRWGWSVVAGEDPATGESLAPSDEEILIATHAYGRLFKRERITTLIRQAKLDALSKGDGLLYVLADPLKPQGSRISLRTLDPRTFFPRFAETDQERVVGVDIVEQLEVEGTGFLKIQRFVKSTDRLHPKYADGIPVEGAFIAREVLYLELDGWESEPKTFTGDIGSNLGALPMEELPGITNLPIYHFKNNSGAGNPFGTSDLAGMEPLIAGINQTVTDADLALAMAGLGFYMTDSGAPIDENGNDSDWVIGPNRVVEVADGKSFTRVSGVGTIDPSIKHTEFLEGRLNQTIGVNDVALGNVDSGVAESGVALAIRMAPLIDATDEKDEDFVATLDQFLYDLREWFTTYEQINLTTTVALSVLSDKSPRNRKEELDEMLRLFDMGLVTVEHLLDQLNEKFGHEFPPEMINEVVASFTSAQSIEQGEADLEGQEDMDDEGTDEEEI